MARILEKSMSSKHSYGKAAKVRHRLRATILIKGEPIHSNQKATAMR